MLGSKSDFSETLHAPVCNVITGGKKYVKLKSSWSSEKYGSGACQNANS